MSEEETTEMPCDTSKLHHQIERHLDAMKETLEDGSRSIRESAARLRQTSDRITCLLKERYGDKYESMKDRTYLCRNGRIEYRPENGPVVVLREGR